MADLSAAADPVLFRVIEAANGRRIGIATLNSEKTLHAIGLPMIRPLDAQLRVWAADPAIACVVLQAAGDKAFSAGGDVKTLAKAVRDAAPGSFPNPAALAFFTEEYRLDHRIHVYPKPLLCWGGGIVMGGGMGLFVGASHRVVTETTRAAMPEIAIGLFPDVGGSWFLPKLGAKAGLFAALTGAPLNGADLLAASLADFGLRQSDRDAVLASLSTIDWTGDAAADRMALSAVLTARAEAVAGLLPPSKLAAQAAVIETMCAGDSFATVVAAITGYAGDDVWLQKAAAALKAGSPTTAALVWAVRARAAGLSLAEVFRMELCIALHCCANPDFPEGVRALLIDKDHAPQWSPAGLAEIDPALIAAYFDAPGWAAHPLADLAV
ncbi:enoyl-CoA hydratase/isomerase family protein [Nevskia sp.]|uniref:enoyl-CoA hydratase/isomerase family protein n=1 Tax=Nevskia sp. TaxID=1929292 RepID=UPI0025DF1194|nr:enoyl-CoA hydratase/isomerase family protein [Nevskia sp.]